MASYLYVVKVNKYNSKEEVEKIHLIANNIGEAVNIANFHVFGEQRYPNVPVEIVSVSRNLEISDIVNSTLEYDDEVPDPFNIEGATEEEIIRFKHTPCSNYIEVLDNGWEEIECPDCKRTINREDLENVGGVWLYVEGKNFKK